MSHLLDSFIEQAEKMKANEVLLSAHRPAMFKVGPRWKTHELNVSLDSSEVRLWIQQQLNENQKLNFLNGKEVEASVNLHGGVRQLNLIPTESGVLVHISWQLPSSQLQLSPPELAKKILMEGKGLYVLSGPVGSGRRVMLNDWLEEFSKDKNTFLFTDQPHQYSIRSDFLWTISMEHVQSSILEAVVPDLIVIDSEELIYHRVAVELAEKGFRVLLTSTAADGIAGIERLIDHLDINRASALRRMSQVFQMLLLIKLVPAIEEPCVPIYDLLLGTEDVRELIKNNKISELESNKRNTLNQSLMSHVLRRKVDLKVSFQESPRPKELDNMFQKAGI